MSGIRSLSLYNDWLSCRTFCSRAIICLSADFYFYFCFTRQSERLNSSRSPPLLRNLWRWQDQGELSSTYRIGLIKRASFTTQNVTLKLPCAFHLIIFAWLWSTVRNRTKKTYRMFIFYKWQSSIFTRNWNCWCVSANAYPHFSNPLPKRHTVLWFLKTRINIWCVLGVWISWNHNQFSDLSKEKQNPYLNSRIRILLDFHKHKHQSMVKNWKIRTMVQYSSLLIDEMLIDDN